MDDLPEPQASASRRSPTPAPQPLSPRRTSRPTWWASGTRIASTARTYTYTPATPAAPTLTIWATSEVPSSASSRRQTAHETPASSADATRDARGDHRRLRAFQAAVEADPQAVQLKPGHDGVGGDRADDQPGDPERLVQARR